MVPTLGFAVWWKPNIYGITMLYVKISERRICFPGNCRLTLRGHVAAPSLLRLAKSGGVLMSTDDTCKDLSVRLWDLHTGKLFYIDLYTYKRNLFVAVGRFRLYLLPPCGVGILMPLSDLLAAYYNNHG